MLRQSILVALAVIQVAGPARAAPRPAAPQPSITFRCNVVAGPKLDACLPVRAPLGLDPRKVEHLRAFAERSCLKGDEVVGASFELTMPFQDSPALMVPVRPGASIITNPDWITRPSAEAALAAYPAAALAAKRPGRAVIACTVGVDTRLHDCQVVAETPPGEGFGEAALKVAELARMRPQMKDCQPFDGGTVRLPIEFRLQP